MNKIKLNLSILISLFCLISVVKAQPWMNRVNDQNNYNFFEVQKAFNDYWNEKGIDFSKSNKDKESESEMGSYLLFKRWEWYMGHRVSASGQFPDPMKAINERKKFDSQSSRREKNMTDLTSNWTMLGPTVKPAGGDCGRLNCIAFNPTDTNTIFVGAPDGGLWKTNNGGTTWSTNTDLNPSLGVTDIVINPADTNIMYIATGDGDAGDSYSAGVMKSTDGGTTWTMTGLTYTESQTKYISRLILHPNNSNMLLAGTKDGVSKSIDGGTTWTSSLSNTRIYDMQVNPSNSSIIYASGHTNIYKSTDSGSTFTSIFSVTGVDRIEIAVTPANSNYIYALCSDSANDGFHALYLSTDGGNTFTLKSSTPNILGWTTTGNDQGGQGWYDLTIIASPTVATTIFIGGVNIWTSTNSGTSWTHKSNWSANENNALYVHADIHKLAYRPGSSTTIYACCDGGIFRTYNSGSNWTDLSGGLTIMEFYSVSGAQTNSSIVIGGAQDDGSDEYNAGAWTEIMGGDGMTALVDYTTAQTMYAEYYNGDLNISTNGGGSWNDITPNGGNATGAWVTPYIIDKNTHTTIYAGYNDVWKSTNQGTSWTQITNTLTGNASDFIMAMAIAPSNSNYLYVGAGPNNGIISTSTSVFKSTDGGTTWTNITGSLPLDTAGSVTAIAVKQSDPLTVWVTLSGFVSGDKVFLTTDGGTTWTNISNNLPNVPVDCITYDNTVSTDRIFVGTDVGVFYTDNTQSGNWVSFNTGLPNVLVYSLDVQSSAKLLRAGTFGRGLWETSLALTGTPTINTTSISSQINVYPNPATGEVYIDFPQSGNTSIAVYNTLGEKVYDAAIEVNSGTPFKIDLSNQSRGVYFIRIQTNENQIYSEKLVLIK
jgi:type IX secretion system substrate protein